MFQSQIKSADIHSTKIVLHPLYQERNLASLQALLQLLKTCNGPCAKLKIIRNIGGGHVSITSSSSRLFQLISIKNTFLKLIVSSVRTYLSNYGNGGIFCSLLSLVLITNSSKLPSSDVLLRLNKFFSNIFLELLQSPNNSCVYDVSSFNISYLQPIIFSIISSKPGCYFTKQNEQDITLLMIKSFISAFPNDAADKYFGKIFFHTEEGIDPSNSKLLNGILVHYSTANEDASIKHCIDAVKLQKSLKIVVFSTSLAGDANFPSTFSFHSNLNIWNCVLSHLEVMVEKLSNDCVNIILCQKVIHPSLKKKLKQNCILVIDRLGAELTLIIEQMSGATAISCISHELDVTYGCLTSLKEITVGKKNYLLFQNFARPVWTIFICNSNEESLAETKIVCQQAIDTLHRLLKNGKACCGAGCTEIYSMHLLHSYVMQHFTELSIELECTSAQLLQGLHNFIQCVQETVLSLYPAANVSFLTETVHGHLWESNDNSEVIKCKCEKHTSENILLSQWRPLQTNPETLLTESIFTETLSVKSESAKPKIMDELCVKLNAIKLAVELSASLLNVSLLISP